MAPINVAFIALLCLFPLLASGQSGPSTLQGFIPFPGYSCPAGYVPIGTFRGNTGYACTPDVCYNDAIGCGPGNACTQTASSSPFGTFYERSCQCNSPYVQGLVQNFYTYRTSCYIPGSDVCNPNPCQNGGTCLSQRETESAPPFADTPNGPVVDFACTCPNGFTGKTCLLPLVNSQTPAVTATAQGYSGPPAALGFGDPRLCNFDNTSHACLYADGKHYVCCNGLCGPIGPDGMTPLCIGSRVIPSPNDYPVASSAPSPGSTQAPPPVSDPQGVCGLGDASPFPTRCYFNNDPQGRYVCCDSAGCDGFNPPDNLIPHCKASGYVPPGYGVGSPSTPPATAPPSVPPSGSQGVCGSGAAGAFPTRCFFNSDPQGRYVCCDAAGCDGFNPPDNLFPHCKANGYVPPGYGVGSAPTPPSGPPSGSQGVCGSGGAAAFPVRCYYNNDLQGRYVCCDSAGCDGFNPPDNFFPHCKANGYVPPSL